MKKSKILLAISILLGSMVLMYSCIEDDFDTPEANPIPIGEVKTIEELKTVYLDQTIEVDMSVYATVSMDDKTGNIYKTAYIQDATGGIALHLDASGGIYEGDSIRLQLKGLKVGKYMEAFQIDAIDGEGFSLDNYLTKIKTLVEVRPDTVTIEDVKTKPELQGKLVILKDVQFIDSDTAETYADGTNQVSVNHLIEDETENQVIVRTSGYASFADADVPNGSGTIIAIVGKYNSDIQLYIRSTDEVLMDNERLSISTDVPEVNTTIDELKALFTGGDYDFQEIVGDYVIEGTVVATDENGNYYKAIVIQDGTSGITLKINDYDLYTNYSVGQKLVVNCNGLYLGAYAGLISLGSTYDDAGEEKFGGIQPGDLSGTVYKLDEISPLSPTVVAITAVTDSHLGMLLQFNDVQFADAYIGQNYLGGGSSNYNIDLEDCSANSIIVRTSSYADFASNTVEPGKGTFIGILAKYNSDYQLYIRDITELDMEGARCAK